MATRPPDAMDAAPAASAPRRKSRLARAIGLAIAAAGLVGVAGFVAFCERLPRGQPQLSEPADGIVVLTGGEERLRDALSLLSAGRARRLLVTGVNPTTTRSALAAQATRFRDLFRCCVDLGYEATNTFGNAAETQAWAERRDFHRALIVVTSAYHMPRALAEMRAAMPGMALIPYPVDAPALRGGSWPAQARALRLLGREYVKYLLAVARAALNGRSAAAKRPAAAGLG